MHRWHPFDSKLADGQCILCHGLNIHPASPCQPACSPCHLAGFPPPKNTPPDSGDGSVNVGAIIGGVIAGNGEHPRLLFCWRQGRLAGLLNVLLSVRAAQPVHSCGTLGSPPSLPCHPPSPCAVVVLACVGGFVWLRRRRVQRMQQRQLHLELGSSAAAGGSAKLGSELSGDGLPSWKARPNPDIDSAEAGIAKEATPRPTLTATAVALGPSPLGRSSAASVIPAGLPPSPAPPADGAEHVAALWASAAQAAAATQQQQQAVSLVGDPLLAWVNSQQRAGPPPVPHDQAASDRQQPGEASGSSEPGSSFRTTLPSSVPSSRPSGSSAAESPGRRPPLALAPSRRGSAMLSQRGSSALVDLTPWEVKYRCATGGGGFCEIERLGLLDVGLLVVNCCGSEQWRGLPRGRACAQVAQLLKLR